MLLTIRNRHAVLGILGMIASIHVVKSDTNGVIQGQSGSILPWCLLIKQQAGKHTVCRVCKVLLQVFLRDACVCA